MARKRLHIVINNVTRFDCQMVGTNNASPAVASLIKKEMLMCTIDLVKVNHTLNRSMTPEKNMGRNDVICLNEIMSTRRH